MHCSLALLSCELDLHKNGLNSLKTSVFKGGYIRKSMGDHERCSEGGFWELRLLAWRLPGPQKQVEQWLNPENRQT